MVKRHLHARCVAEHLVKLGRTMRQKQSLMQLSRFKPNIAMWSATTAIVHLWKQQHDPHRSREARDKPLPILRQHGRCSPRGWRMAWRMRRLRALHRLRRHWRKLPDRETMRVRRSGKLEHVVTSNISETDDEFDDNECANCGGEGFTLGCSWDWQCDTYDSGEGTCLCERPCDWCRPRKPDPELQKVLAYVLAPSPPLAREKAA